MKTMKKYAMGGTTPTTTDKTTKKPKVVTKKPKSVSERIGDLTFRDVKDAGETALQIATLGGYGKINNALGGDYKYKKIKQKKYGGKVTKAKNGTSLGMKSVKAGFDKNPGVTRADVIVAAKKKAKTGISVPKKNSVSKNIGNLNKAKSGKSIKTCRGGCN
jgi:hypothetical protein